MPKLFTVYDPNGAAEQHTRPNCNDLVNGAGYTWKKGQSITPAALSPHRVTSEMVAGTKDPAQAVLDRKGNPAGVETEAEPDPEEDDEPAPELDPVVEEAPEPAAEVVAVPDAEPETEAKRRGRPPKSSS